MGNNFTSEPIVGTLKLTREDLIHLQEELCIDKHVPIFAPLTGICWKCLDDCVTKEWATEHITACGLCHWSFCD